MYFNNIIVKQLLKVLILFEKNASLIKNMNQLALFYLTFLQPQIQYSDNFQDKNASFYLFCFIPDSFYIDRYYQRYNSNNKRYQASDVEHQIVTRKIVGQVHLVNFKLYLFE